MSTDRTDIRDAADVERLVAAFYAQLVIDPVVGHFFTDLDLAHHLPKIEAFWRSVLFGERGYTGDPMTAHIALHRRHPMEQVHFDRWLALWNTTIDAHFSGPHAVEAKSRAATIAPLMAWKVRRSGE